MNKATQKIMYFIKFQKGKISDGKNWNNGCFWREGAGNACKVGLLHQIQDSQVNLNFR